MAKPKTADILATKSGFPRKLRTYFHAAEEEVRVGGTTDKVLSAGALATYIRAHGVRVTERAINYWQNGRRLPHARVIGILERLFGAPWIYLDDPRTAWPRKWTRAALLDLVSLLPDDEVERFAEEVKRRAGVERQARR